MQLEIDIAQLTQRAVGTHFGCSDGAFENRGDFGESVSLETTQEQDFAVIPIELVHRMAQELVIITCRGIRISERAFICVVVKIGRIGG